ncbi:MAG: AAA-like domain-containing protein, partial [Candidatus Poribacteria bacterium]
MHEPTTAEFYVAGGTLRPDAPSYVRRQADDDLYDALSRREFCYVLTSRQMGKSSLMARVAQRLRGDGATAVLLDLTAIGQNVTVEQWYDGLLVRVGEQLDLEDELEEFWDEHTGLPPVQRWMTALRRVVLPASDGQVVVFVDEIDVVQSVPFSTGEFFVAIRECYTRRSEDDELERLSFCLIGVATPSDLIEDPLTTPFNVGVRIELTDFGADE